MLNKSIGMIELRSIAIGIKAADEMLKAAAVEIVMSTPVCPGKYIILVTGNVGPVKNSVDAGVRAASDFLIDSLIINSIHEKIIPVLYGKVDVYEVKALGIIETKSVLSSIKAGDTAIKSSNVDLLQIRIARQIGGKGLVAFSGEYSSVNSALKSCTDELGDKEIMSTAIIPSPHKDLISTIFKNIK
jgi:microcompartment protein CcmL/EutN